MRYSLSMKIQNHMSSIYSSAVKSIYVIALSTLLIACEQYTKESSDFSKGHIHPNSSTAKPSIRQRQIPKAVKAMPFVPAPTSKKLEKYSVSVQDVSIRELLFAISRDAKLNLDINNGIEGNITLNAIDQTLPQIMDRISNQTAIRYHLKGNLLVVEPDTPYLKHYSIDYLNVTRESESTISTSTGISDGVTEESDSDEGNNSFTSVKNHTENKFWDTLSENLTSIVNDTPTSDSTSADSDDSAESTSSDSTSTPSSSVIINREAGVVYVRATSKQHKDIQMFLDIVLASVRRQVLIEATVAEVALNDQSQLGVDWATIADDLGGFSVSSTFTGTNFATAAGLIFPSSFSGPPSFNAGYQKEKNGRTSGILLKMLDQYGDVKVLSSPKIMALNNQTSLLKVVDNKVYFSIDVEIDNDTDSDSRLITYDTTAHSVPVGFIMNVTPFVNDSEEIILNIRPTLTRILSYALDPNPALADAGVTNPVPEVQVRELESVLRVNSGNIAVIGGLMQDSIEKDEQGISWLSTLPIIGDAFSYKNKQRNKTELIIFLKPTLIKNANIERELKQFRQYLPSQKKQTSDLKNQALQSKRSN